MYYNEIWFPCADGGRESRQVVGRFVDHPVVYGEESRRAGREITKMEPFLESKIAGDHDIAAQWLRPFNADELKARFPGAWAHYEKMKALLPDTNQIPDYAKDFKGTPIERADFVERSKYQWFRSIGIHTLEQLADISDAQCEAMGHGSKTWRKKAKAKLADIRDQA